MKNFSRDGFTEKITLSFMTSKQSQKGGLLVSLNAFGDDPEF